MVESVLFPREEELVCSFFFFISLQGDIIVSKEMFLRIFDVKKEKKVEETVRFFSFFYNPFYLKKNREKIIPIPDRYRS